MNSTVDWVEWHKAYDNPDASLSRRLQIVRARIGEILDRLPNGPIRLLAMCSGDGRDILPVLVAHPRGRDVSGRIVELDERLVRRARKVAPPGIEIVQGDAGTSDAYQGAAPADLVMCCGVFGNVTGAEVQSTIAAWRFLCSPSAFVIWTRAGNDAHDPRPQVREWVVSAGFREVSWDGELAETYGVGVSQLVVQPEPFSPGERIFQFTSEEESAREPPNNRGPRQVLSQE